MQTGQNNVSTSFRSYTLESTRAAIKYINANVEKNITIDMLARKYDISPSALKRCFKAKTGLPVYTYIRRKKMKKAKELLKESDMSVTNIAYHLGFINSSKFSSAFTSVVGERPSSYRKNAVAVEF